MSVNAGDVAAYPVPLLYYKPDEHRRMIVFISPAASHHLQKQDLQQSSSEATFHPYPCGGLSAGEPRSLSDIQDVLLFVKAFFRCCPL